VAGIAGIEGRVALVTGATIDVNGGYYLRP
jgi:hypothetical protein